MKSQVLRIGTAENGTRKRWYATNGHESTFLWAVGESRRYANSAPQYPHYLAFFAGLNGLETTLYVLPCETNQEMLDLERSMIKKNAPNTYYPIWEPYIIEINKKYFPLNEVSRSTISEFGSALQLISNQRNTGGPPKTNIPDVLSFKSGRSWENKTPESYRGQIHC